MSVNLDSPKPGILTDWPLLRELRAVAGGRLCGAEEQRRCRTASGPFAAWACAACEEYLRPEALSPWTWHLLFLYRLQRAGYPFRASDLSLETWLLLGVVQKVLEDTQRGKNAPRQNHGI
ncbi:MAG: hypothetical protein ACOZF2_00150 [Thermodesulfobacteriota bacterium]